MSGDPSVRPLQGTLEVADDKMSVRFRPSTSQQPIDCDALLSEMRRRGLAVDCESERQCRAVCEAAQAGARSGGVTVLVGRSAIAPQAGRFRLVEAIQRPAFGPMIVRTGQVVAEWVAGRPGVPGQDVYGATVACPEPSTAAAEVGPGVTFDEITGQVTACIDGAVHLEPIIGVWPVRTINADLSETDGLVETPGVLVVAGALRSGASVRCGGDLYVAGVIEQATVVVGGSVCVRGGIAGCGKARIDADRHVSARFLTGCRLTGGGDVRCDGEITHCDIRVRGTVCCQGTIVASQIDALVGVECHVIGSTGLAKTTLTVGVDPKFESEYPEVIKTIERNRKRSGQIRAGIEPLMRCLRRLTTAQREKATELLYEADTLDTETDQLIRGLKHRLDELRAVTLNRIRISGEAKTGTTLRFPGVESVIRLPQKGPLTIRLDESTSSPRVIAQPDGSEQIKPLESRRIEVGRYDFIRRVGRETGESTSNAA